MACSLLAIWSMQRHWRTVLGLFGLILLGFLGSMVFGSSGVALTTVVAGLVLAFVMAIAYLRADGHSPESHAHVDHALDDTNP